LRTPRAPSPTLARVRVRVTVTVTVRVSHLGEAEELGGGCRGEGESPLGGGHKLAGDDLRINRGEERLLGPYIGISAYRGGGWQATTCISTGGIPAPVPCAPAETNPPICCSAMEA
jgi:hypothetical protein